MQDFDGKVAVITGAASGIGLALAHHAAGRGMRLALADIEAQPLADAAAALVAQGARAIALPTDVTDPAALESLRDATIAEYGAVHLVCNNAGVGGGGRTWEVPLDVWRWVIDVDLFSVIYGVHTFGPLLVEQGEGHVVNTASIAGLVTPPGLGPYTVAKHGVVALSETLHHELAGTGVGVSVLCPSFVRTRIHESDRVAPPALRDRFAQSEPEQAEARAMINALIDSGMRPEEVAEVVFDGIETDRFLLITHPESLEWITSRITSLLQGVDLPIGLINWEGDVPGMN
jgi:NAD(P)-dependent dehydrogenase (short-subunit alcohol dehydrogenase family)